MPALHDLLAVASGSLVGFIFGLVGGGGSILAVPLSVYVVGIPNTHVAIGTSAIAHTNAVENLVIFATLVLILHAIHHSTASTVLACAVFFWARLAHAVIYMLGVPVLRTLAFTVGFLAQVALVLAVFGKL
jgi:uncharacterized MAPEG superfamily protein